MARKLSGYPPRLEVIDASTLFNSRLFWNLKAQLKRNLKFLPLRKERK